MSTIQASPVALIAFGSFVLALLALFVSALARIHGASAKKVSP